MKKRTIWKKAGLVLAMVSVLCMMGAMMVFANSIYLNGDRNFVEVGGSGTNNTNYIDITSVNVHEYNPPYYIIAFNRINWVRGVPGYEDHISWHFSGTERYRYDYDAQKMYIERKDENGTTYWFYLDPSYFRNGCQGFGSPAYVWWNFAQGEIAFMTAYHMSFFKTPVTDYAKRYWQTLQ